MELILRNHKKRGGRYDNQFHSAYTKIFKILEGDSLGFVQEFWEESFVQDGNDWVLELNDRPDLNQIEKILAIRNVELVAL